MRGRAPVGIELTEEERGFLEAQLRKHMAERSLSDKCRLYQEGMEGELFDLEADPGEVRNLWRDPDSADLKSEMLLRFAQSVLASERMKMPRVAHP